MSSIMFLGVMVLLNQIEFGSLAEKTRDQFSNRQQTVTQKLRSGTIITLARPGSSWQELLLIIQGTFQRTRIPFENSICCLVQTVKLSHHSDLRMATLTQNLPFPVRRFRTQPNTDSEKLHTGQSETLIADWSTILKPRLISRFVFPQQNPCSQLVMITHFSNQFLLQKDNWLLHVQTFKL